MIVCFGSINLDLVFPVPHLPTPGETVLGRAMRVEPGGKGANQAVAAARDGARVLLAGAVGRDALAAQALATLRDSGVDTGRVAAVDTATGAAAICVDPDGRNLIAVASGANLLARAAQVEDAVLGPETTLLVQAETELAEVAALIRRAKGRGCRVVLNLAPAAPLAPEVLRAVDVLVVNQDEGGWLGTQLGTGVGAGSLQCGTRRHRGGGDARRQRARRGAAVGAAEACGARRERGGHHRRRRLLHRRAGRGTGPRRGGGGGGAAGQRRRRAVLHAARHAAEHADGPRDGGGAGGCGRQSGGRGGAGVTP